MASWAIIFSSFVNNSANNLGEGLAENNALAVRIRLLAHFLNVQRVALPVRPNVQWPTGELILNFHQYQPVKIMPSSRCNDAARPAQ